MKDRYCLSEVLAILGIKKHSMVALTRSRKSRNKNELPLFQPSWPGSGTGIHDFYSDKDIELLKRYFDIQKQRKDILKEMARTLK